MMTKLSSALMLALCLLAFQQATGSEVVYRTGQATWESPAKAPMTRRRLQATCAARSVFDTTGLPVPNYDPATSALIPGKNALIGCPAAGTNDISAVLGTAGTVTPTARIRVETDASGSMCHVPLTVTTAHTQPSACVFKRTYTASLCSAVPVKNNILTQDFLVVPGTGPTIDAGADITSAQDSYCTTLPTNSDVFVTQVLDQITNNKDACGRTLTKHATGGQAITVGTTCTATTTVTANVKDCGRKQVTDSVTITLKPSSDKGPSGNNAPDLTCNLGCSGTTITEASTCTTAAGASVTVGAWLNDFANVGAQTCPTLGGTLNKGTISPARPYHKTTGLTVADVPGSNPKLVTTFSKTISDNCGTKTVTAKLYARRCCASCTSLKLHNHGFWNQHVCSFSTNAYALSLRACATTKVASVGVDVKFQSLAPVCSLFSTQTTYKPVNINLLNFFISFGGLSFPSKSVCGLVTSTPQTNNPWAHMGTLWGNMYCAGANPNLALDISYLISKAPACKTLLGASTGTVTLLKLHELAMGKVLASSLDVSLCLGGLLGGVGGNTWDCTALTGGTCH